MNRRHDLAAGTDGDDGMIFEPDRITLAEVLDPHSSILQFEESNVVLGYVQILQNATRDIIARGAAAEFERAGRMLDLLSFQLVGNTEAEHDRSAFSVNN